MALELFRIDERLLHGQVIVGWGMRLHIGYYVIMDDELAVSAWEQDLYAAGLPEGIPAHFLTTEEAKRRFQELDDMPGRGALLTRSTAAMRSLAEAGVLSGRRVNVGGLHAGKGRRRVTGYVYVTPEEAEDLKVIADHEVRVSARDLPGAEEVGLKELLHAAQ